MLSTNCDHRVIITQILRSRLTRPSTIGTNILLIHEDGDWSKTFKPEQYDGKILGCFITREDQSICFCLIHRNYVDKSINHLLIYYFGAEYRVIQEEEFDLLNKYIPDLRNPELDIKIGVINVNSSLNPASHLSLFVEAIDYSFSTQMIDSYEPLQIIETDARDLAIGLRSSRDVPKCSVIPSFATSIDLFKAVADNHSISFNLYHQGAKVVEPGLGLMQTRGHFIGILYSPPTRVVNYVLCHDNQFADLQHYEDIKDLTRGWITSDIDDFCCTRFYPNTFISCCGDLFISAIDLCLFMAPHVLTVIQENELRLLMNPTDRISNLERLLAECKPLPSFRSVSIQNRRMSRDALDSSNIVESNRTQLLFSSADKHPLAIETASSSQATEIIQHYEIQAELSFWREVSRSRQRIRDSLVPPVHKIEPFSDFVDRYLKDLISYGEAVSFQSKIWSQYARTVSFPVVETFCDKIDLSSEGYRFAIYPFKTHLGEDSIIIVDRLHCEWVFLHPGNSEAQDLGYFHDTVSVYIIGLFPELTRYEGRPVAISSSSHKEYPRLHLLMSLYVISRLFRYCIRLPKKVNYGEWELRRYASNILNELQISNAEYNVANDLIDERGYVKIGGKESMSIPLKLETTPIPKDQCMFCLKRKFNNLGRHMSMAHGGQASAASNSRF